MDQGSGFTRNQYLLWLVQQAHAGVPLFNELLLFQIEGAVEHSVFSRAFQSVVNGSDALRTLVHSDDGNPVVEVLPHLEAPTHYMDFSNEHNPDDSLQSWARQHVDKSLDLGLQSFESTLIKLGASCYAWVYLQHQLLLDGSSMAILYSRLDENYQKLVENESLDQQPYPQFSSYLKSEHEHSQSEKYIEFQSYWEEKTKQVPDPVTFYRGRTLSREDGLGHNQSVISLDRDMSRTIAEFGKEKGVRFLSEDMTLFNIFTAALYVYLYRISGQRKIAIGVPWQNRRREYRNTIGLLMEQNPFVISIEPQDTFKSVLKKIRTESLSVMRHMPYAASNPGGRFFNVTMNFAKEESRTFANNPVDISWLTSSYGAGSLGIRVYDSAGDGEIKLGFDFNENLFNQSEREACVEHFMNCLESCIEKPDCQITTLALLSTTELAKVKAFGKMHKEYIPEHIAVMDLIGDQVLLTPDAIAVSLGNEVLTYAELDRQSSLLCSYLLDNKVETGDLVGICLERSIAMCVCLQAILKAGCAYVPIDPDFPSSRISHMLSDSGATCVVTSKKVCESIEFDSTDIIYIDNLDEANYADRVIPVSSSARANSLAYVLYTSGTTGKPKGVDITHGAFTNLLLSMKTRPGFEAGDVLLAVTTLSFDIAGLELFLPLICGGRVEIAPSTAIENGHELIELLKSSGTTMMQATPTTWRMLLACGWSYANGLRILCGGEPLTKQLAAQLLSSGADVWNMYGPTETTIWSSVQKIVRIEDISLGKPILNTDFMVVDSLHNPVPIGVPGELLIGGRGLARGYRNLPQLTSEKFISRTMCAAETDSSINASVGNRYYKTGDMVRWDYDGRLLHMGRIDNQVKVLGYRIEPQEIEALIDAYKGVESCAVIARKVSESSAYLAAYIVLDKTTTLDNKALRQALMKTLPVHMIPSAFVVLDALPLTPNAKIDKKALLDAAFDPDEYVTEIIEARTRTERALKGIWQKILQRENIGIDDDFWELGGQSLIALKMLDEVQVVFGVTVSLQMLVNNASIKNISSYIDDQIRVDYNSDAGTIPVDNIHRLSNSTAIDGVSGQFARAKVEKKLQEIWQSLFPERTIDVNTSFLDLSVSTEKFDKMLEMTRFDFGTFAEGLSTDEFRQLPTLGRLADSILANMREGHSDLSVMLRKEGNKSPLFLIHAAGGYVFFFKALARKLTIDRPVIGIRASTEPDSPHQQFLDVESVEALAKQYVKQIKALQPRGPYSLGGACFGAVVAYEIAQQLIEMGDRIDGPLFVFSSVLWNNEYLGEEESHFLHDFGVYQETLGQKVVRRTKRQYKKVRELGLTLDALSYAKFSLKRECRHSYRTVKQKLGYKSLQQASLELAPADMRDVSELTRSTLLGAGDRIEQIPHSPFALDTEHALYWKKALDHSLQLSSHYKPQRYNGSIAVFQADETGPCSKSWVGLASDQFIVYDMPCVHLDMLEEPLASKTAKLMADAIARTDTDDEYLSMRKAN